MSRQRNLKQQKDNIDGYYVTLCLYPKKPCPGNYLFQYPNLLGYFIDQIILTMSYQYYYFLKLHLSLENSFSIRSQNVYILFFPCLGNFSVYLDLKYTSTIFA